MSSVASEARLGREEDLEEAALSSVDIDKKNEEAKTNLIQRLPDMIRTHLPIGWKFGVTGWVAVVIMTLFINIGFSVFVTFYRGFQKGIGTLLQGECSKITAYNIGAHLTINVLSTLLLSGSNYCMQCLSAPTRREIDKAHERGIMLDIGIPSSYNLGVLDPWKILMWILLAISSLPLHLLSVILPSWWFKNFLSLMPNYRYNSVIYPSIGANDYLVFLVNQTFVERYENASSPMVMSYKGDNGAWDPIYDRDSYGWGSWYDPHIRDLVLRQLQEAALAGELDRLDNEDCIQSYGKMYLSNRSNLLLVGSDSPLTVNGTTFIPSIFIMNEDIDTTPDPVSWICPYSESEIPCVDRLNEVEPQNWTVNVLETVTPANFTTPGSTKSVYYCLSQPTEESCKLQFSLPIAIVIIFFNFFKAVIMLILAFGLRETRVQTIGDAIASFLIQPDHIVNDRCLYSASDFKQGGLSGNPRDLIFTNNLLKLVKSVYGF